MQVFKITSEQIKSEQAFPMVIYKTAWIIKRNHANSICSIFSNTLWKHCLAFNPEFAVPIHRDCGAKPLAVPTRGDFAFLLPTQDRTGLLFFCDLLRSFKDLLHIHYIHAPPSPAVCHLDPQNISFSEFAVTLKYSLLRLTKQMSCDSYYLNRSSLLGR